MSRSLPYPGQEQTDRGNVGGIWFIWRDFRVRSYTSGSGCVSHVFHRVFFPTVKPCLCLKSLDTAVKTDTVVAADCPATVRALPFLLFFFYERINSVVFDECQVFEHAHMVPFPVAFIKRFEPVTGKVRTFVAEIHPAFGEQPALFF